MLGPLLDHLGELGDQLPQYTASRCLLERQAVGGCTSCQTVCPHQALTVQEDGLGVQLQADRCTGCGLCVQHCPTGALERDPAPIIHQLQEQEGQATLACGQSGVPAALACLAGLGFSTLAAAAALDLPLTLLHGDCAGCPVGSAAVPEHLRQLAEAVQCWAPLEVTLRPADDQDRPASLSRRAAWDALLRRGKYQLARRWPERAASADRRLPLEWQWRRNLLRSLPGAERRWPAPIVDELCIDCPVCANVCPTQAIQRELLPDGGGRLLLDLGSCTSCLACQRSCPPGAIHEQSYWQPAAFDQLILLRQSDHIM